MYKVGQKVVLSPKGLFKWSDGLDKSNPKGKQGVVTRIDEEDFGWFHVRWENGRDNCYEDGDLDVIE